jgi:hypothetical protein
MLILTVTENTRRVLTLTSLQKPWRQQDSVALAKDITMHWERCQFRCFRWIL